MSGEFVNLAGCVITDQENRVLLLHRIDHNQWQLPGGRIKPDETPEQAARREASDELGLAVSIISKLGEGIFSQGEVVYHCEWYRVHEYEGDPLLEQPELYDDFQYHNLLRYDIGRLALSPNVARLVNSIEDGDFLL